MAVDFDLAIPFNDGDVEEGEWSRMAIWFDRGIGGVCPGFDDELLVYANASGREVHVKGGALWLQGKYGELDDEVTLPIGVAPGGGNERVDVVVVRLDYVNHKITLDVKPGTNKTAGQGHTGVAALQRDSTMYEQALARVLVSAGVTSITVDKVIDTRTFARSSALKVGATGWVNHPNLIPAGAVACDGRGVSRYTNAEYAAKIDAVGTDPLVYVPDMRGEVPAALDDMVDGGSIAGAADRLPGKTDIWGGHYGDDGHVLVQGELPNLDQGYLTKVASGGLSTLGSGAVLPVALRPGGGAAHNNVQPTHVGYWFIWLRPQ